RLLDVSCCGRAGDAVRRRALRIFLRGAEPSRTCDRACRARVGRVPQHQPLPGLRRPGRRARRRRGLPVSTELQTTNGAGISTWQPQSLNEAMKLADYVSKSGLVPDALRGKAADTLLVMMKGRELGLSVMQSLAGIHVIKGQTQLSAATMRALVVSRRDVCKYFRIIEQSNQCCTVETWRIGNPEADRASFSIEDA